MNHIGLFEGIGGFSLAASWMDWKTIAWCEINPFCQKVLKYYWPDANEHYDIKETDFTIYRGQCDIITGGFPCQPYSQAGKRLGKEDDRHLWPEMLRAIREIQPRWIVGENVRGLVNWSGGLVFDEVQADLEAEGYEVLPFILPACAKNAPHRRDRVWFVAYSESDISGNGVRNERQKSYQVQKKRLNEFITTPNTTRSSSERQLQQRQEQRKFGGCDSENDATNTNSRRQPSEEHGQKEPGRITKEGFSSNWENFPTQPPVRSRNDGLSSELAGITFSKHRNESIKAYGNAVVPQVVFEIFKAIELYETE